MTLHVKGFLYASVRSSPGTYFNVLWRIEEEQEEDIQCCAVEWGLGLLSLSASSHIPGRNQDDDDDNYCLFNEKPQLINAQIWDGPMATYLANQIPF